MYKHTRMDDQNDSDSLPSWLKDDKNVMGGTGTTADTRPLVTTTLSKTSSYGGGGGSSSSDHAAHVEEDYGGHDASFVTMDSMPMGGGGEGGLFKQEGEVDISWAVDPESQSQQTRRSSNRGDNTSRTRNSREDENKVASRKNYGSVMEVDQKRQRHWQDYPEDDESQEEEDEDEQDEDDSGSSGGSESDDDDDSSDSSDDSHDGSDEEETKLISSTSTKNWTREKSTRYQKQSSSSQKGKKWYNGGSSFNNNGNQKKKKKRKKVMRRDDKKRGKRTPPRRNCCHSFFIVVQIAAILANLCMIAIEVVPMVFVLRAHKPETVQILDVALRCYFTFFSTSFLVTELEWIDSSLNNWITRGFLYTFLGVVAREQHLAMLANGTLVVKENSKDYWNGVWASLFVEISSWWIIGIGVLYFLLGLFCMKVVRNRFREQYQARLRDFYDNEEEYEDS